MTGDGQALRSGSKSAEGKGGVADQIAELLRGQSTQMTPRWRQQLALVHDKVEMAYAVREGLLALHAGLPSGRRLILGLVYPGDVYRGAFAPALAEISLTAMMPSSVLRLRGTVIDQVLAGGTAVSRSLCVQFARQQARMALHASSIGFLTSEERVTAFLIELALQVGAPGPGGLAFDMPMSRSDVAAYLALNPDTLSRHMSRLKDLGLVEQRGRSHILIRDVDALYEDCEIADALRSLYGPHTVEQM